MRRRGLAREEALAARDPLEEDPLSEPEEDESTEDESRVAEAVELMQSLSPEEQAQVINAVLPPQASPGM